MEIPRNVSYALRSFNLATRWAVWSAFVVFTESVYEDGGPQKGLAAVPRTNYMVDLNDLTNMDRRF